MTGAPPSTVAPPLARWSREVTASNMSSRTIHPPLSAISRWSEAGDAGEGAGEERRVLGGEPTRRGEVVRTAEQRMERVDHALGRGGGPGGEQDDPRGRLVGLRPAARGPGGRAQLMEAHDPATVLVDPEGRRQLRGHHQEAGIRHGDRMRNVRWPASTVQGDRNCRGAKDRQGRHDRHETVGRDQHHRIAGLDTGRQEGVDGALNRLAQLCVGPRPLIVHDGEAIAISFGDGLKTVPKAAVVPPPRSAEVRGEVRRCGCTRSDHRRAGRADRRRTLVIGRECRIARGSGVWGVPRRSPGGGPRHRPAIVPSPPV